MTDTFKTLYQNQLTTAANTLLYGPIGAGTQTIVKQIRVVNTDTAACGISFYTNGTAAANIILPEISVDAGGFAEFEGTITLGATNTLYAKASVASCLTVTVYGLEITA
jgi:hypothetical protein